MSGGQQIVNYQPEHKKNDGDNLDDPIGIPVEGQVMGTVEN